jgi:signal transduction histidine kinase
VDDTIKNVRKISANLRPKLLDQLGFLPAIEWQVKEFSKRTKIKCDFDIVNYNIELNPFAASTLFRIFQESLTNITRHSKASKVIFSIRVNGNDSLIMKITDNGVGFNGTVGQKPSLGILGMKERAQSLGGNLSINSVRSGGTEVVVNIPLTKHLKYD